MLDEVITENEKMELHCENLFTDDISEVIS